MGIGQERSRPIYQQSTENAAIISDSQCDTIYDDEELTEEDIDEDTEYGEEVEERRGRGRFFVCSTQLVLLRNRVLPGESPDREWRGWWRRH